MFWGLKPAVAAIVFIALWKIADRALKKWIDYVVALFSVVALLIFNMPYPLVIVSAIMIGWVYVWFNNRKASNEANTAIIHIDETAYCINGRSGLPHTKFSGKKLAVQLIIAIVAWALPMVFFYFFSRDFLFWKQLSVFFTKAALLSFGGAYSVLVYVAQISVNNLHWLTQPQMVDGLALGETTPGPLIMVLAFVGFMGSYHHFNSLALASVGLIVTTYFTFLPSFVFVLAGAPIIEHTHENRQLKLVLGFVTSAVVGVIANLTIFTTKAILFSGTPTLKSVSWPVLFWIIISVVAMKRFNTNMVAWIMVSAVYGLLIHFLL
jgi:chromate transporter